MSLNPALPTGPDFAPSNLFAIPSGAVMGNQPPPPHAVPSQGLTAGELTTIVFRGVVAGAHFPYLAFLYQLHYVGKLTPCI